MSEIADFVRDALKAGSKRQDVRDALAKAGWQGDEIEDALARYADVDFPIPVPHPKRSGSAKEAFLYMATFSMLYTSAISLGIILTALINVWVPDPVHSPYSSARWEFESILASLASLIVAFPIYFTLTRSHIKRYPTDPERRTSVVRRWLTYFTMFVAFSVIVTALIMVLYNALTGELAARFLLKALLVLAISSGIYLFYRWELKIGGEEGA